MNKEIAAKIDQYLEENRNSIVEDLKALVSIPSVSVTTEGPHPYGDGCAKVLDAAIAMAEKKGFTAKNHIDGFPYSHVV
ncbi:MAG: hypothetical protein RR461_02760, partial [Angelakisella sp.]